MVHRLDPLLRPRSIAVVGASEREDSMGAWALCNLARGGYEGRVCPVNPRRGSIGGRPCYASLAEIPDVPDLVIFAVADHRLEAVLDEAIALGVPAAVIMSTLALDDDEDPPLAARVRAKVAASGMLVCGANGMGYYNVRDRVWACGFDSADHEPPGKVAIISHSGAGMSGVIDCEERLAINFAVSAGNELSVAMDDYLDFVLDLPETRVVGLFIETIRNPAGFLAALEKAASKRVPIVALKTGRTEQAARLTVSHSGALAGDDAVFDAIFDHYGVQRVRDQEEWTTALILFSTLWPIGEGGLVTLHDSGGERQLMIDLAADAGVTLTRLGAATVDALADVLPPELPAVNPLDAWSRGGATAAADMARCFALLTRDPGAALGAVVHNRAPYGKIYSSYRNYLQAARDDSRKPVALVSARQGTGADEQVVAWTRDGYPVVDGVWPFLVGVRSLFAYRDYLVREPADHRAPDARVVRRWRERARTGDVLGEAESLLMLEEFGIPTSAPAAADSIGEAVRAARRIGYPIVLKSARPGLAHKTETGGVVANIVDDAALGAAYRRMSDTLGGEVLIAPMIADGVEMLLGAKTDAQFGPVIVIGFGGVLAETLQDIVLAIPPRGAGDVRRLLNRLRLRPLLDGVRGSPAVDVDAFCECASRFSALVVALGADLAEVDVNPVIVTADGAVAVDALVVPAGAATDR
jgi:acyl-CoA synthetase (NDP forming)